MGSFGARVRVPELADAPAGITITARRAWSDYPPRERAFLVSGPGTAELRVEVEAADERDALLRVRQAVEPLGGEIIGTPPITRVR